MITLHCITFHHITARHITLQHDIDTCIHNMILACTDDIHACMHACVHALYYIYYIYDIRRPSLGVILRPLPFPSPYGPLSEPLWGGALSVRSWNLSKKAPPKRTPKMPPQGPPSTPIRVQIWAQIGPGRRSEGDPRKDPVQGAGLVPKMAPSEPLSTSKLLIL